MSPPGTHNDLKNIFPEETELQEVWAYEANRVTFVAIRTEQIEGKGEDGPPTALFHASGRGLIAVYDGAGGAGGGQAGRTADNRTISGAFFASRQIHFALEGWFRRTAKDRGPHDPADGLVDALREALQPARGPRRRIISQMVRELPTTLAAIEFMPRQVHDGFRIDLAMRWAGDSRCYRLIPDLGLQLLSRDDSGTGTEDSVNDQPMTNMVSADREFTVNELKLTSCRMPTVLICATDGFFGYLETPAHAEYLLLRTLAEAEDPWAWGRLLARTVRSYTKDDASVAIAALDFEDFASLKNAFATRLRQLEELHWRPFDGLEQSPDRTRLLAEARQKSWQSYRTDYESQMPPVLRKEAPREGR